MERTLFAGISGILLIMALALWMLPGFYWLGGMILILIILSVRSVFAEITRKSENRYITSIILFTVVTIIIILLLK